MLASGSKSLRRILQLSMAALAGALTASAMIDSDLVARARLFPSIGAGVTALHHSPSGRFYVLTERAGVEVFDGKGQPFLHIPAETSAAAQILYGADLDVDNQERVYVADRGAGAVKVYSPEGRLERRMAVAGPTSLALLPEGEVAVASLTSPKLVTVFNAQGRLAREFGEPSEIASRQDLNRYANIGRLARDPAGRLYYAFRYLPEPTVRRYDRNGFSDFEIALNTPEYAGSSLASRKELAREEKGGTPMLRTVLGPVAVDGKSGEVWVGMGGRLLRFGPDGTERGSYLIYTPEEARIEASALLLEPARIVVASAELGIFELPRPSPAVP
jgi:hypothetical protein